MPNRLTLRSTVLISFAAVAALTPSSASAATETVLYAFQGGTDGAEPYAVPTMDSNGNLYGTTLFGGIYGDGIVYKLTHSKSGWSEKILHSFAGGSDGAIPYGGVVLDARGNVYGGTREGGVNCSSCGVVYELSPGKRGKWKETILYSFRGNQDSEGGPLGALTLDGRGNLYGTTVGDDTCGGYYGTVFELHHTSTGWKKRDLHDFCGSDGQAPAYGQLVFDAAGNIYGTTGFGGSGGLGVVFEFSPAAHHRWTFTTIHSFTSDEGGVADGGLTLDASGNVYGAAADGGSLGNGSVYRFAPQGGGVWSESIPYAFNGSPDGVLPFQNPVFDANGNLFGTTYSGGDTADCYDACGTIYELVPQKDGTWKESIVYDFAALSGGADGYQPVAGLIRDSNGNFYGTTTKGGDVTGVRPCDCGAVYEFKP